MENCIETEKCCCHFPLKCFSKYRFLYIGGFIEKSGSSTLIPNSPKTLAQQYMVSKPRPHERRRKFQRMIDTQKREVKKCKVFGEQVEKESIDRCHLRRSQTDNKRNVEITNQRLESNLFALSQREKKISNAKPVTSSQTA